MLDRLRYATEVTKFKADQLLRVKRVQGEITSLRREIQLVRDRIAGAVLELRRGGQALPAEVEQLCLEIDRLNAQIAEREALIAMIQAEPPPQMPPSASQSHQTLAAQSPAADIRPTRPCPYCGFRAPLRAAFCPNCGKALPKLPEHAAPDSSKQPASPAVGLDVTDTTNTTDTTDTTDASHTPQGG